MSGDTVDGAEDRQPRFDLLTFSMGLAFWSICTALSITGLMMRAGVATASGFWAEIERLYHDLVLTILGGVPRIVGLPEPDFDKQETVFLGLLIVVAGPFFSYIILHRVRTRGAILTAVLISGLLVIQYLLFGYSAIELTSYLDGIMPILVLFMYTLSISFESGGTAYHLRNVLGAVVILTSLATTGYFTVTP